MGRYRWSDIEDVRLDQPRVFQVLFVRTAAGKGPTPNALCRFDEAREAFAAAEAGASGLPLARLTAAVAARRA